MAIIAIDYFLKMGFEKVIYFPSFSLIFSALTTEQMI